MGQCESSGMSRAYDVNEDKIKNLSVGQELEIDKGCGPAISGMHGGTCYAWLTKRGFSMPSNGEFQWAGLGSQCAMCSNISTGYGCDNCSGSKAVTGRRGKIKRISYNATASDCCQSGASTKVINGKTCNPIYCNQYQSSDCDNTMSAYCQGSILDTYPEVCKKWIHTALDNNRSSPNAGLRTYCSQGANYIKPICQEWVDKIKNSSMWKGEADQALISYCDNYPTDEKCRCMNPPENVSKVEDLMTLPKACWYRPCKTASENYLTSGMRDNRNNCTSTTCYIEAGDISVSGDGNSVNFANECATSLLKDPTNAIGTTNAQEGNTTDWTDNNFGTLDITDTDNTINTTTSTNYLLPIGGGVALLCSSCCCILIIIILLIMFM